MAEHRRAEFRIYSDAKAARVEVVRDCYQLLAQIVLGRDCETHLALCLAALVEAGWLDANKLDAALKLARPVAAEHVAREGGS